MSVIDGHPLALSSSLGGVTILRPKGRRDHCKWRRSKVPCRVRAALVEARPRPVPAIRDGTDANAAAAAVSVLRSGGDSSVTSGRNRTDDMQAEAKAMARAANASVYTPQLLATNYGSRPFKVNYPPTPN